jgi:hypothetical protein
MLNRLKNAPIIKRIPAKRIIRKGVNKKKIYLLLLFNQIKYHRKN